MRPYIGITDFTDFSQVQEMRRVFTANCLGRPRHMLHIGVMMSYKTLNGIPSKWEDVFPPIDQIASIFSSDEVFNCLHYADYNNSPRLGESLAKALSYGGSRINALQLDMIWPDPDEIEGVVSSRDDIEIILQIGKNALEEVGNAPERVVQRLRDYKGLIHRVLLDKSMGRGIGMNAFDLIPLARAIRDCLPTLGIVAAGGLGPKTIDLVKPLVDEFPDLSIDAEGQLRPSGNALDPIDWDMATIYLIKALQLFA